MAAGEMVRTPLQAVLIGGVLAALPIGAVTFFASAFEMVWIGRVHLAFIVTPILPIAMILSSYRAGCLGEPAGRGRIQRGAVVLTAALVITPVLFAATDAVRPARALRWRLDRRGRGPRGSPRRARRVVRPRGRLDDRHGEERKDSFPTASGEINGLERRRFDCRGDPPVGRPRLVERGSSLAGRKGDPWRSSGPGSG